MSIIGVVNVAMLDWPWSVIHGLSGLVIGVMMMTVWPTISRWRFFSVGFGLLVLWEIVEILLRFFDAHAHLAIAPLKQAVGGFAFAPETTLNIFGDLVIGSAGLVVSRWMVHNRRRQRQQL